MPPITVFVPITRHWALERWLDNLYKQSYPPSLINLCVIVDIDDARIMADLQKFIQHAEKCERPYRSFYVKNNTDWQPDEVHIGIRQHRIADIHNQSKALIAKTDGEYVVGLEDDTVFEDPDTIGKLVADIRQHQSIAFVEGVQIGRHGTYYVGAWLAKYGDTSTNMVTEIKTVLPPTDVFDGMSRISGGGMYGYITPRDLYIGCDYFNSTAQPWGVDVNYGLWLEQQGYKCYIDWGLPFAHNAHNVLLWPNDPPSKLVSVTYTRNANGGWDRRDV
jgi:hypothetical protein